MYQSLNSQFPQDRDGQRLLGLARIKRCAHCSRLRVFEIAYIRGKPCDLPVPPPPEGCTHQVCGPLIDRFCVRMTACRLR
jgi:hypothetical protein